MAKMKTENDEDILDDPIKLIDYEQRRVSSEANNLTDAELMDYGCETDQGSLGNYLIDPGVRFPLVIEQLSETSQCDSVNNISLSVKVVDCIKFPWYYTVYKHQIYNIKHNLGTNNLEVIELDEGNSSDEGKLLDNCTKPSNVIGGKPVNNEKVIKNVNLVTKFFVDTKGRKQIDFKRNTGLKGLYIKRNFTIEKRKTSSLTDNIIKFIVDKIDDEIKCKAENVSRNGIISKKNEAKNKLGNKSEKVPNVNKKDFNIIETTPNTKLDDVTEKVKSTLPPGSYQLSRLSTGEKLIKLVPLQNYDHTFNKDCEKNGQLQSSKEASNLSFRELKSEVNAKKGPAKGPTPKKTVKNLSSRPMPKCKKLELEKQRKTKHEREEVINIIENKLITGKPILIGSRLPTDKKYTSSRKATNPQNVLKIHFTNSDNLHTEDCCDVTNIKPSNTTSSNPQNNNLSVPCSKISNNIPTEKNNNLLLKTGNVKTMDNLSNQSSSRKLDAKSMKISSTCPVNIDQVTTNHLPGTSEYVHLESSNNMHSNCPKSIDSYFQSHVISTICTDNLIYTVSNHAKNPSVQLNTALNVTNNLNRSSTASNFANNSTTQSYAVDNLANKEFTRPYSVIDDIHTQSGTFSIVINNPPRSTTVSKLSNNPGTQSDSNLVHITPTQLYSTSNLVKPTQSNTGIVASNPPTQSYSKSNLSNNTSPGSSIASVLPNNHHTRSNAVISVANNRVTECYSLSNPIRSDLASKLVNNVPTQAPNNVPPEISAHENLRHKPSQPSNEAKNMGLYLYSVEDEIKNEPVDIETKIDNVEKGISKNNSAKEDIQNNNIVKNIKDQNVPKILQNNKSNTSSKTDEHTLTTNFHNNAVPKITQICTVTDNIKSVPDNELESVPLCIQNDTAKKKVLSTTGSKKSEKNTVIKSTIGTSVKDNKQSKFQNTSLESTNTNKEQNELHFEYQIKDEPIDSVTKLATNVGKEDQQRVTENSVSKNTENNTVPQNIQQCRSQNKRAIGVKVQNCNFAPNNNMLSQFISHETIANSADKTSSPIDTPGKRQNVIYIKRPAVPVANRLMFNNVTDRLHHHQHHLQKSRHAMYDNQRPNFYDTNRLQPNCAQRPQFIPQFQHRNLNYDNYYEMPDGHPRTPYNNYANWHQPYYCNNNAHFYSRPHPSPCRPQAPGKKVYVNVRPGKNLNLPPVQNASRPKLNAPVNSKSEMLEELDRLVVAGCPDADEKLPNVQKPSHIPVHLTNAISSSQFGKQKTQSTNENKLGESSKNQGYSPPILPIPTLDNIMSQVEMTNIPKKRGGKPNGLPNAPKDQDKTGPSKGCKQKLTLEEYKKRSRTRN